MPDGTLVTYSRLLQPSFIYYIKKVTDALCIAMVMLVIIYLLIMRNANRHFQERGSRQVLLGLARLLPFLGLVLPAKTTAAARLLLATKGC